MEFDVNKLLILLGVVVLAGIGVNVLPKFMGRNMSTAMLENALDFNLDARRACIAAVNSKAKKHVDDPSTTEGNGKTRVVFTWTGADSSFNKISCTYEGMGKGITSIVIDGVALAL
jgi:hypothetical protein